MNLFVMALLGLVILFIEVFFFSHQKDQKLIQTVTSPNRGTWSERRMILGLLKSGIPAQTIFHDLYVRKSNGKYSQIDLVVATSVGIIVFEIKDYGGWIYGTGNQNEWTQVLAYGQRKYRFYNPILQNRKHIIDLSNQLPQCRNIPYYSIVVFFGNCTFKDLKRIPEDVFLIKPWEVSKVLKQIQMFNPQVNYTNKSEVVNLLQTAVQNGTDSYIREEHIRNIEAMLRKRRFN